MGLRWLCRCWLRGSEVEDAKAEALRHDSTNSDSAVGSA